MKYALLYLLGVVIGYCLHKNPECQQPVGQYTGYTTLDADHIVREFVYRDTIRYDWHDAAIGTSKDTLNLK